MCVHVFDSVHVVHKSIISSIVQLIFIGLATPIRKYICDRLRENRAQRGVRNIEKRSIDFLKMYCFKPTEGNG